MKTKPLPFAVAPLSAGEELDYELANPKRRNNNFTRYCAGAKLARLFVNAAEEARAKGNVDRALKMLISSQREMILAMNNAARIGFGRKLTR